MNRLLNHYLSLRIHVSPAPAPGRTRARSQSRDFPNFSLFRRFTTLGNSSVLSTACLESLSRMTLPQNSAGQWLVCTGNDVDGSSPTMSSNDNAPSPLPADGVSKRKQGMYFAPCLLPLGILFWRSMILASRYSLTLRLVIVERSSAKSRRFRHLC